MKFGSKYTAYTEILRADEPILHPRTGLQTGREKPLIAEFGQFGDEYVAIDPDTGSPMIDPGTGRPIGRVATIHGGQWDSLEWQANEGATDEERQLLEDRLMQSHRKAPTTVWPIADVKRGAPLPKWDELSAARKLAISAELGILDEALAYETQEATDLELVARLQKKIAANMADAVDEAALTTAA